MLLVGRQEGHPACEKLEWWGTGVVICLQRGGNFHMAQLMPLPLTVSCFSKIQIGFTFLVPAHLGSPGQRAVKRVCVTILIYRQSHRPTNQTEWFIWTNQWLVTKHYIQVEQSSILTSLSSVPSLLTAQATSDKSKPIVATESTYLWASRDNEM